MICQHCNKNMATIHISTVINNKRMDVHLCESCAAEIGMAMNNRDNGIFKVIRLFSPGEPEEMPNIDETVLENVNINSIDNTKLCPSCGTMFADIINNGNVGCDRCYVEFAEVMTPFIEKLQGAAKHVGKVAKGAAERRTEEPQEREQAATDPLQQLETALSAAVDAEDYEKAIELRDAIKSMKEGAHNGI